MLKGEFNNEPYHAKTDRFHTNLRLESIGLTAPLFGTITPKMRIQ